MARESVKWGAVIESLSRNIVFFMRFLRKCATPLTSFTEQGKHDGQGLREACSALTRKYVRRNSCPFLTHSV